MGIVITGLARHGKDTVCEQLRDRFGWKFESSSRILLEEVIYPALREKYNYKSKEECYNDRDNHRKEWFELLIDYNTPDLTALGRKIFEKYDIYCGLRNKNELEALKAAGLVTTVVWVDAENRLGVTETTDSITISSMDADIEIMNNFTLDHLYESIETLNSMLMNRRK